MHNLLKLLILLSLISFFSLCGLAGETVRISKKLQWADLSGEKTISPFIVDFDGALREAPFEYLPQTLYRQSLGHCMMVESVQWLSTEIASANQFSFTKDELRVLTNQWHLEAKVTEGGGSYYLSVTVLPLKKENGGIERLLSYELDITLTETAPAHLRTLTFADNSVLSEGTWYKVATGKDGVYKIDKTLLTQLGIDIATVNPAQFNVYGNGGALLPDENSEFRFDDLQKCSITFHDADADQQMDAEDYFLFYAKGPDRWKLNYESGADRKVWEHTKHYYSDSAYYFLRTDDALAQRIQPMENSPLTETHTVDKFQDFQYYENDVFNLGKSGRRFFGDEFDNDLSNSYNFNFPNLRNDYPAFVQGVFAVHSVGGESSFTISSSGNTATTAGGATGDGAISSAAVVRDTFLSFNPEGSSILVNVQFNKYSSTADVKGYIDYLRVNATQSLSLTGNQMIFRDSTNVGVGEVGFFQLASAGNNMQLWDITDYTQPAAQAFELNAGIAEWKQTTELVRQYIAFNNAGFLTPVAAGKVANQNLHAITQSDIVIITAPALQSAAESIAQIHASLGNTVTVANVLQVFNEFSSGNPDVTALRMMMKMLYDRAGADVNQLPENLLLLGDGDYLTNKGITSFLGSNLLVFESDESLSPTISSVSDDYFVFLSDTDNISQTNSLDCGVGRICASSLSAANDYVKKIEAYIASNTTSSGGSACLGEEVQSPYGPWRNVLTFIADDQDGSGSATEHIHLDDADALADTVRIHHKEYDIVKIYMDAYKQESTPGGERYPDGEAAIRNRVENGSLLVTYLGHGGERGWAHERILDENTISNWTNLYRMPVFLTATCELARYDDPSYYSAGEKLVMNPNGGAIAMLTTTRIVFAGSNMEMDLAFYDVALEKATISDLTLGKINMLTKNGVSTGNSSKPNFSMLGDPALKLVYPKYEVYTTHINGIALENFTDTLKALQEVEFTGFVGLADSTKLTSFKGFVYPTVFDKMTHVYTQNNDAIDGGVIQQYDVFNKNIFKGKASVTGGDFSFKFVVPFDINYTVGHGRVSYYAVAGNDDGHGYSEKFLIGSALTGAQLNTIGPEIQLYLNDTTFVSGGVSNTTPILLAKLKDENGINTVGNGIGHDLSAVMDADSQNPIILNEYYETDLDTYKSGEVRYQLSELSTGSHSISLRAWDVHNNSSTSSLNFLVAENSKIALDHVLNYPNPFTTHTEFMFEHNQACEMLEVRVQIFTIGGKLVKTLLKEVHQNGFRSDPILWDGTDDYGDRIGKGVYIYKLDVQNETGQRAQKYEKLVILK